ANPVLPKGTTEGMLSTLPAAADLVGEQALLTPTRKAIAAASVAIYQSKTDALLLKTIASGLVVSAVLVALFMRAFSPLLGLAMLIVAPVIRASQERRRENRCETEVAACREQHGFSASDYIRIRGGFA